MSPTSARSWRSVAKALIWAGLIAFGGFLLFAAFAKLSGFSGAPDGGGGAAERRSQAADDRASLLFRLGLLGGGLMVVGWVIRKSVTDPDS